MAQIPQVPDLFSNIKEEHMQSNDAKKHSQFHITHLKWTGLYEWKYTFAMNVHCPPCLVQLTSSIHNVLKSSLHCMQKIRC